MGYVYILKSITSHRYYVGSTDNIERRIQEHNEGKSKYTRAFIPWKLFFKQEYITLTTAKKVEAWLKKQKDKEFLERIIQEGVIKKAL